MNTYYTQPNENASAYAQKVSRRWLIQQKEQARQGGVIRLSHFLVDIFIADDKTQETINASLAAVDEYGQWHFRPCKRAIAHRLLKEYGNAELRYPKPRRAAAARKKQTQIKASAVVTDRPAQTQSRYYDGNSRHNTALAEIYYATMRNAPVGAFIAKAVASGKRFEEVAHIHKSAGNAVKRRLSLAYIEASDQPGKHRDVLAAILAFARTGYLYASHASLAEAAGCSIRTVQRAMRSLQAQEILSPRQGYRVIGYGAKWAGRNRPGFELRNYVYRVLRVSAKLAGWPTNANIGGCQSGELMISSWVTFTLEDDHGKNHRRRNEHAARESGPHSDHP